MTEPPTGRTDWKFLLPLVLGTMMNPLNSTMLATALATICAHFSENVSAGSLLITPLYIAAAIGQPLMGRLADMYNPKVVNRWGFIIVLVGAAIGILAPSFEWLIVSRVLFGLGTAAAFPSAMALIAYRYGNSDRAIPGNVMGIITVASQVTMVIGPLLGGFLTELFGWQGVFLINLPWAIVALWLSRKGLPSVRRQPDSSASLLKKTDAAGVFLFAVFLVALLIALTQPTHRWLYIPAVVVSLAGFVAWERRQSHPFVDVKLLWHQPALLLVYVRTLGTNYILYLLLYSLPQWMESVKSMSPSQTGLMMIPLSLMSALAAIIFASKVKRVSVLNTLGVISLILACSSLFLLHAGVAVPWIVGVMLLVGLSIGLNIIANQSSLSVEAPLGKTGVSFGLYRTFGYLGAIVSGTQLKAAFHSGVTDSSLYLCGWYAVACCVLLTVLTFIAWKPKPV